MDNQTKPSHSPLPWKQGATYSNNVYDGMDRMVLTCNEGTGGMEANARFIVQACNNYKALLQGCEDALFFLKFYEQDIVLPPSAETLKQILSEAIVKAEKGS